MSTFLNILNEWQIKRDFMNNMYLALKLL